MYNYLYKFELLDNFNLDNLLIVKYKISMWIEYVFIIVLFLYGGVLDGELKV